MHKQQIFESGDCARKKTIGVDILKEHLGLVTAKLCNLLEYLADCLRDRGRRTTNTEPAFSIFQRIKGSSSSGN